MRTLHGSISTGGPSRPPALRQVAPTCSHHQISPGITLRASGIPPTHPPATGPSRPIFRRHRSGVCPSSGLNLHRHGYRSSENRDNDPPDPRPGRGPMPCNPCTHHHRHHPPANGPGPPSLPHHRSPGTSWTSNWVEIVSWIWTKLRNRCSGSRRKAVGNGSATPGGNHCREAINQLRNVPNTGSSPKPSSTPITAATPAQTPSHHEEVVDHECKVRTGHPARPSDPKAAETTPTRSHLNSGSGMGERIGVEVDRARVSYWKPTARAGFLERRWGDRSHLILEHIFVCETPVISVTGSPRAPLPLTT